MPAGAGAVFREENGHKEMEIIRYIDECLSDLQLPGGVRTVIRDSIYKFVDNKMKTGYVRSEDIYNHINSMAEQYMDAMKSYADSTRRKKIRTNEYMPLNDAVKILEDHLDSESYDVLNRLAKNALDDTVLYVTENYLVNNAIEIGQRLKENKKNISKADEKTASTRIMHAVYGRIKYYDNPLDFFEKHAFVFGKMGRGEFHKTFRALYESLDNNSQLDLAIPESHRLTNAEKDNIVRVFEDNFGGIRATEKAIGHNHETIIKVARERGLYIYSRKKKTGDSAFKTMSKAASTS